MACLFLATACGAGNPSADPSEGSPTPASPTTSAPGAAKPGGPKAGPGKDATNASADKELSVSESSHNVSLTLGNLKSSGDLTGVWAKVTNEGSRDLGPLMLNLGGSANIELFSARPGVATPKAEIACLPQNGTRLLRCLISGLDAGASETFDIRLAVPEGRFELTASVARPQRPGILVSARLPLMAPH